MTGIEERLTGGELFLQILRNHGVEYLFSSPGTEWAPLWEALAKQKAAGIRGPEYLCARHEDVAIGMASGYAKATGKLGVCLIHSSVGSMRAAMGVRGAYQAEVPLLVCSGESITFGEGDPWVGFHWGRYLADYGGPARFMESVVKSSYGVACAPLLAGSIDRACSLAQAPAPGPVFLSIPFEFMAKPAECAVPPVVQPPVHALADAAALESVARKLQRSTSPLIITERLGRNPAAVEMLVRLGEATGATVVEAQHPEYVNFPRDHDLHGGFNAKPHLPTADLILLLDMVGPPWYPETALRPGQAEIIVIGEDPLRSRVPYNGITGHLTLYGRAEESIAELLRLLPGATPGSAGRRERSAAKNAGRRAAWHRMASDNSTSTPIDARWMCEVLNRALPEDAILVDETIISNFTLLEVMDRLRPGQYINAMDGGLGTGLGAALGVKVANPQRPVIAIIGDGGFNYNAPLAVLGFSQEYSVPITIVIGNNRRYRAMQMVTEQLFPDGCSAQTDNYYGSFLDPPIRYADMAVLVSGYGETVSDPAQVEPALQRALQANREGRIAILDIVIDDELKYLMPLMKEEL